MQTIYLVPHTHYDVVWAFSKEEYFQVSESILEEALRLMENSEFKFCIEQTFLLKEIEKGTPPTFPTHQGKGKSGATYNS